jgi:serine protease Do
MSADSLRSIRSRAAGLAALAALLPLEAAAVPASPRPEGDVGRLFDFSNAISTVAESAVKSVVSISTKRAVQAPMGHELIPFFGPMLPRGGPPPVERGLGSGVILRKDGIIVTNNHVVAGAQDIMVTLDDQREIPAKIVGTDPSSDLAVLKLEQPPNDLVPIELGDSEALRLGEIVIAIGSPLGFTQTVSMGIVSAKGRGMGLVPYEDFIQTDAAINPGNSGGALLNLAGEVVGINSAIASKTGGNEGIGFAIPSDMVQSIVESLLKDGKVIRGFLGVNIQDLTPDLAKALGLRPTKGVLVTDIREGTPAAEAGMRAQDVIIELDGERMETSAKLRRKVAARKPGTKVAVKIIRDGSETVVAVKLGKLPDSEIALGPNAGADSSLLAGLRLEGLDDARREQLELSPRLKTGVVVIDLDPSSPGARSGLRPGDVIIEANKKAVGSPSQLRSAIGDRTEALLRVYRGDGAIFVLLRK